MNRGIGFAVFMLFISACSLAGDVTPPPALATAQMAAPSEPPTPVPLIPPSTDPDLANGEAIYFDKCAACHGLGGLGDGELADGLAFAPAPLGDPEFAQSADPAAWYRAVTIGNLDRLMPGFRSLTDQERWDVVGYALSLGAASPHVSEPEESAEEQTIETGSQSGSVIGRISNASAGAELPEGLEVSLLGFDGESEVYRESLALEGDGSFAFEGLEYVPGRLFFTAVEHEGLTYRSDVAHAAADGSAVELPITIYETSTDPSSLRVERLHLLFDFPSEDVLRVLEVWVLANDSDRVLVTPLQIALPDDAANLSFEQGTVGGRFELTNNGFVDLEPIPPGSGIDHLVFGFDLPISRSTDFDQVMLHPVDAVTVLIPPDGPKISGLQERGIQDVGGIRMQSFNEIGLAEGDPLAFRVSAPPTSADFPAAAIVGAGALAVAALVVARTWFGARTKPQEPENYVQAIAELDDDYEAGHISEREWEERRESLKRQALKQMERKGQ